MSLSRTLMMKMENLTPDDWENGILDSCIDFYNGYAFKSDDLLDEPIPESLMFSKWEISKKAEDSIMKAPKVG